MYEIIEKNQYGVLVKNTTNYGDCFFCKYEITQCNNRYKCINDSYYLPDSEAEKLESENPLMNTTIDDLYIESKCYFEVKKKLDDTQKELIEYQKKYLFVESNTSLSIAPNKINTSILQLHHNGNVILEFMENGDIFIKGELVENNIDVVNMLKDICYGEYVQQTDSDTQKELIDLQNENKQLKERVKELEGTIDNNVTEVSEFFNDGVEIFECNSCGMLMEENEPYNNYCPNCGRKIKK